MIFFLPWGKFFGICPKKHSLKKDFFIFIFLLQAQEDLLWIVSVNDDDDDDDNVLTVIKNRKLS